MRILPALLAPFLMAAPAFAQAAAPPVVFTINIISPASTSATCTPPSPLPSGWTVSGTTYSMPPIAAGTVLCTMSVQPSNWAGGFVVSQASGPQANAFTMSGMNFQVGSTALTTPGAYAVTVTLTP